MDKDTNDKKTETTKDPKVESMLKALGYLDSVNEQAKLPADRESEEPEVVADGEQAAEKEAEATASEKPAQDSKAEEAKGEAVEENKEEEKKAEPEAKQEAKDEKRVKKVTPKIPSLDEIADVVKDAVADAKREPEKKEEVKPEDTFRKQLHPAELKALELAEAAEKYLPDRYKGAAEKEVQWIRKHREFVHNYIKDNGKLDTTDETYLDFIRANRPQIPQHDREELILATAEERAAKRAKAELEKDIQQRDRAIAELKFSPVIEKVGEAIQEDILASVGEEFSTLYKTDPKKIAEEFPIEAPIIVAGIADTATLAKEYLSLAKGIKEYKPGDQNHERIVTFIEVQGKHLDTAAQSGTPHQRDGKTLISREKFYSLQAAGKDVSKFSTFTDDDVIKMLAWATKEGIKSRVEAEKKRYDAARASAERRAAAKSSAPTGEQKAATEEKKPATAETKQAATPPKGGATASKGTKTAPATAKNVPAHLKILGYDGVKPSRE